jgi:selenocysteine lyase/cysteine desulfurase
MQPGVGIGVPGLNMSCIGPPCRLRISLSAAHTEQDVQDLLEAMRACSIVPQRSSLVFAKL